MAKHVMHEFSAADSSTEQQREIWLAAQLSEEANCSFNETLIVQLRGPLDGEAFMTAMEAAIRHHEAVRICLSEDGRAIKPLPVERILMNCRRSSRARADDAGVDELARTQHCKPFRLDDALLRLHLFADSAEHHYLLLTCHSLIGGTEVLKVISRDILASYHAAELSPQPDTQLADWEQSSLGKRLKSAGLDYWANKLRHSHPFLEFPLDRPRPPDKRHPTTHARLRLSKELVQQLHQTREGYGWNPSSVLMAAYAAFAHRLTGQAEILFGFTAQMDLPDGAKPAGAGSRLLPLKVAVSGTTSFASLVDQLHREEQQSRQHRFFSFSELIRALNYQRDASRPILLSTAFDVVELPCWSVGELEVQQRMEANHFDHLDMRWTLELGDDSWINCVFNPDLWRKQTIDMRLQEFVTLLGNALAEPATAVEDLEIIPELELQRLMQAACGPQRGPAARDLVSLLDLTRFAERTAVICGADTLSYGQLDSRSSQLAWHLMAMGVGRDDLVGVFVERSVGMLVSLLAIWKAGAAYVALDPNYPSDRLLYMAETAQLKALITEEAMAAGLDNYRCPRIYLDLDAAEIAARPTSTPTLFGSGPDATAYVIFTSGSTGRPKGVQITHGGVINFLLAMSRRPGLAEDDRFLAVTTLSFDIAIMELCLPLLVGGRVIIARREEALDGYRLLELIDEHKINVMQATPTTWRWMLAAGWQGQADFKLLCGGEPFPIDLARLVLPRVAEVWNLYGPTEATVWSTCHRISAWEDLDGGSIPVGTPVDNTQCYILDDKMRLVPNGVPGELYIGGAGVANGYIRQPEKTAEVFLPDIIHNKGRLYRTGDQARWRLDGNFECLGRLDGQIKLRGYRIELGEIEAALASHADVLECAVKVVSYSASDQRLVAYLKLAQGALLNSSEVRAHTKKFLPEYMVPQLFMEVDALPLTPNGKIDRNNLPHPDPAQLNDAARVLARPSSETEQQLLTIWSELLKKECESVDQLFFDAGGHSLLAMDMIAIIQQQFGVRLHVLDILVNTGEQIAAKIEQMINGRLVEEGGLALEV